MLNIGLLQIQKWERFFWEDNGATAVEYALLLSLITLTALSAQSGVGAAVFNMYDTAAGSISAAMS